MTSRFAPVAPVAVHHRLAEEGALGDYHLLLAHQVLNNPQIHKSFYRHALPAMAKNPRGKGPHRGRNGHPYIIMDNSLIELGYPLPVLDVLEAAMMVRAEVFVLPDVLGDRIATLERSAKAMEDLTHARTLSSPIGRYARKVKALGVAQGVTFNDVFSCARDLIQVVGVEAISIPRHVTARVGSRIRLVQAVRNYQRPIHLLGFSDNLFDDFTALSIPGVMGIDSALPIWYGLQGFLLPTTPPVKADFGKRPPTYDSEVSITPEVIQNIRRVERWARLAKQERKVGTVLPAPTGV